MPFWHETILQFSNEIRLDYLAISRKNKKIFISCPINTYLKIAQFKNHFFRMKCASSPLYGGACFFQPLENLLFKKKGSSDNCFSPAG